MAASRSSPCNHEWPFDLWDLLDSLAACLDEEWQRPADPVPPPIEQERELL